MSQDAITQLLDFWFADRVRSLWFNSTPAFDEELRENFIDLYQQAAAGELSAWESGARGALALAIALDQFPLNMFRGRPESFATEAAARAVARRAIERGFDRELRAEEKLFLYLPFMHSEDLADQDTSVALFTKASNPDAAHFAQHHRELIRRFGRFPHRNKILGRTNTPEETAYLNSPEAFLG